MEKSNKELAIKLVGNMMKANPSIVVGMDFPHIKNIIKQTILILEELDEELKK